MKINKKYGYLRVSSKSQESKSSIEFQKNQLIRNRIQAKNIRVEVGFVDNEIKTRSIFQNFNGPRIKTK